MIAELLLLMSAPAPAAALPSTINERVKIDGRTYRVRVVGRVVKVYDKAVSWKGTVEQSERMQRAVLKLTGCQLAAPTWDGNHLTGVLDCD